MATKRRARAAATRAGADAAPAVTLEGLREAAGLTVEQVAAKLLIWT